MTLFAFEGFGIFIIDYDPQQSSNLWSMFTSIHFLDTNHGLLMRGHSSFFFFVAGILTIVTWTRLIQLDSLPMIVGYSILFGYVSTKAMIDWAFPLNTNTLFDDNDNDNNISNPFPFLFLFVYKSLNTFVALYSRRELKRSSWFMNSFLLSILFPWMILIVCWQQSAHHHDYVVGVIWSVLISSMTMVGSFRGRELWTVLRSQDTHLREWLNYARYRIRHEHLIFVSFPLKIEISATNIMAFSSIIWSILALVFQTTVIDADLLVPVVALVIFACEPTTLPEKLIPLSIWMSFSSIWWIGSVIYHIFLMHSGVFQTTEGSSIGLLHSIMPYSVFGWDDNVSIWSQNSLLIPMGNLFLAVLPFPAIYFVIRISHNLYYNRPANLITDEVMMILGIMSIASVVAASVDCVRYLGLLGAIGGIYHSFAVYQQRNQVASSSDRYL
jgi:hypothetical protein